MLRSVLVALILAAGLALSANDARADAYLFVRDGIYLNARIGPGTRFRTHHVLRPGTRLQIITRVGDWAQVRTPDGLMLWVFFTYLVDRPLFRPAPPAPPIFILPRPPRPRVFPPPPHWHQPPPHWHQPPPRPRIHPQPRVQPRVQPHPRVQPKPQPRVQPRPRKQPKVQRPTTPNRPNPPQQRIYDPNEVLRVTPDGTIIYKGR
ncbi:SH3 domain-containing protein [Antarcticimicrobium luteum]|uniref:SH3b domain-containing protein n=1 Tax=Antarcticimicrobium luteum TaxID=2547397 RepID=A0A4R5V005_9RHOB|nr:SH3 domain-containing protein [Antarcticimicrobium luteum]TDK45012.1 hypothetical protein E1832_14135 [Antarcticimicrobium luteum]